MADFQLGVNGGLIEEWENVLVSPDILSLQVQPFNAVTVQALTTSTYTAGDPYFVVDNPEVFWGQLSVRGDIKTGTAFVIPVIGTPFSFSFWSRARDPNKRIYVTSVTGTAVNCAIGSRIQNRRINFINPSNLPFDDGGWVNPETGEDTGYPIRLLTNQQAKVINSPSACYPNGEWTLIGKGTGKCLVNFLIAGINQTVNFVNGVPTNDNTLTVIDAHKVNTWNFSITETDPDNPLRNLRFVCPGTAKNGQTYLQNYIDNESNPTYFQFHNDYLDMHMGNRQRGVHAIRNVNAQQINRMSNPVPVESWSDMSPIGQAFGTRRLAAVRPEILIQLSKECNTHCWLAMNYHANDAWVATLAGKINAGLASGKDCYAELANENWNNQYGHRFWMAEQWQYRVNRCSITRSTTTATVTKTNHGLTAGVDTVWISNVVQNEYNGEFLVASVLNANQFTYTMPNSGASPATTYDTTSIVAFKVDGFVKTATSFSYTMTSSSLSFTIGLPTGHGYNVSDMVFVGNCEDPSFNGVYQFNTAPGANSGVLRLVYASKRPLPNMVSGTNIDIPAKSGQVLRVRRVVNNTSQADDASGIPSYEIASARYNANRSFEMHNILATTLGSRLRRVIAGQAASGYGVGSYTTVLLDTYRTLNGGSYPAKTWWAIAPYFQMLGTTNAQIEALVSGGASDADVITAILDACQLHIDSNVSGVEFYLNGAMTDATARGLPVCFYECGQHMVYDPVPALPNNVYSDLQLHVLDIFMQANRSARMGTMMLAYFNKANAKGIDFGLYYNVVGRWANSGFWGAMESQAELSSPPQKYNAMLQYMGATVDPPTGSIMMYSLPGGLIVAYRI